MHGDESTATKSLFDLFNFINTNCYTDKEVINLLEKCTLLFIPMLNPDGALAYTRENAHGIDLNRDARALKSKEGKLLMEIATDFKPNFAFNLHDQSSYNSTDSDVATLSFLTPASDEARTVTASRSEAMSVIGEMYTVLQDYLPNKIGRYNDTYNADCFGDNFQLLDFPTILIESGHYPGDEIREETRKFHFIALLSGLHTIANKLKVNTLPYFTIPFNRKRFYDLKIDNVYYKNELISVGIRFIYQVKEDSLIKVIDTSDTISGSDLQGKLFHKVIDAKEEIFSKLKF